MSKNWQAIRHYQKVFPDRYVSDVFEAIDGSATVFFADGSQVAIPTAEKIPEDRAVMYVIEARVSRDAEGNHPLPSLIGPFDRKEDAISFMEGQAPLSGSWNVSPLTAPEDLRD